MEKGLFICTHIYANNIYIEIYILPKHTEANKNNLTKLRNLKNGAKNR